MSTVNTNFIRTTLLMLFVGSAILLGIVASSLWLVHKTQESFLTIVEERRIRSHSADLLQSLSDAETGQRGYVITQDQSFLGPYQSSLQKIAERRPLLEKAVPGRSVMLERIPALHGFIDAKLAELARTVGLVQAGKTDDAIAVVRTEYGRELMDNIRETLGFFIAQSDENIAVGVKAQLETSQQLRLFTIGGGIAIIIVLGGAVLIIVQHVRELSRARAEVESLNTGLEERVNERTEDLMRANQEIQRYAYIVTHDLRAPLVNIMGFTSELETSLKSLQAFVLNDGNALSEQDVKDARLAAAEDLPEAISFIRSSTKKMDGLINAILKISRDGRRQIKPETLNLSELVDATSASVHHQVMDGDGVVEARIAARTIITDRFSLEQILGNLFDNAVKYKHPDRPLHLMVRAMPEGRSMVRIEVEDNGRGIAEEDHERVFELFRRSGQQDQGGEGIGLAHVRSLARNLGGEITVRSELGKGSTFVLRLPADLSRIVRS